MDYKQLKKFGKLKINADLSKMTTFKIGGKANFCVEVEKRDQVVELIRFLTEEGLEYFVLGGGSNVLMPDEGFEGIVVRVKTSEMVIDNNVIVADAGVSMAALLARSLKEGLKGLEWAAGLPGTVGGAVRGNAGANGGETGMSVLRVEALVDGEIKTFSREECEFSYRCSRFKKEGGVILKVFFQLTKGVSSESLKKVQDIISGRKGKQPQYPSAGCFFKNVKIKKIDNTEGLPSEFIKLGKVPVGWLIDNAGLKGYRVGGAMIANEHSNFIINVGKATQNDVLKIVEEVKTKVYNKFNIALEEEVQIVN